VNTSGATTLCGAAVLLTNTAHSIHKFYRETVSCALQVRQINNAYNAQSEEAQVYCRGTARRAVLVEMWLTASVRNIPSYSDVVVMSGLISGVKILPV